MIETAKAFALLTICALAIFLLSGRVLAQEDNSYLGDNSDVIELELIQEVQNPRTQIIEYTLRIKSLVDTNRLRVNWEVVYGHITPVSGYPMTDAVDIKKDQEIFITKRFHPATPGNDEIRISAYAFGPFDDYYSFTDTEFFISKELEIAPEREEYVEAQNLMSMLSILKIVLVILSIVLLVISLYSRFRTWLDSD